MNGTKNMGKTKVKQSGDVDFESKNEKPSNEYVKKKRKAPDVPNETKSKQSVSELNGTTSPTLPLPISHQPPLPSGSSESLTSSSVTTDYSPSSRSFTFSSFSGSVETEDNPQNLSVKSLNTNHLEMLHGYDPTGPTNADHKDLVNNPGNAKCPPSNDFAQAKNAISQSNGCADITDYVEKAIFVSSSNSLLSASPSKSSENVNSLPVSLHHHHPPRLTSFESSSTLHHEGLKNTISTSGNVESELKPRYVTLDFVKSAAAEDRSRRDDKTDNAVGSSSSSLSSSFMSSVGSEISSTIGSDVVESLYNKITAATAKYNAKNPAAVTSPTVNTGDIKKDLFPLIFPGHLRQTDVENGNTHPIKSSNDNSSTPAETSATKSEGFASSNFSNSKWGSSGSADFSNANSSTNGLSTENFQSSGINNCERCSGVIVDLNQTIDEEMKTAKAQFGQCSCENEDQEPITEMDYSSCNLKEVPEDIKDYSDSLLKLVVESNTITELPLALFQCHNLAYLSVSDNDIAFLPPVLARLVNLKYLDISKNVIEDIPECISCCKSLEVLDTSVNPIEKLQEGFTQLINLQELYMNDCFFDFLPASFGRLTHLKVLELRDNQLQLLPKSMKRLAELRRLDLGGNVFQDWEKNLVKINYMRIIQDINARLSLAALFSSPDVIPKMDNLSELWMDCNELSQVPTEIGNLSNLTYLDLSRNFLETIPSQVGFLDRLTDLLLAENTLTSLPDSIGFLSRLTVLNLELNHLTKLPVSFGKLKSLEEVDLSHNKLEHLPNTIGKLKNLRALLLDENMLSDIPLEIGCCNELNILQLSRNHIETVPNSIGELSKLRVLNICQNRIPYLPVSVSKLTRLEALWISPNQSKPKIQLHSAIDSKSRNRILTNVLFPQEENGPSRAMKLLGQPDENDAEAYANDAADDDDLDAYARRERGKTHVVFNLGATTYSDAIIFEDYFDNVAEIDDTTFNMSRSENESSKNDFSERNSGNSLSLLSTEKDGTSKDILSTVEDLKPTQTSSFREDIKLESKILDNEEPMQAVEDHSKIDSSHGLSGIHTAFVPDETSEREFSDIDFDSDHEIVIASDEEDYPPPPTKGSGLMSWSSRSNLPSALTERTEEWNPDEDLSENIVPKTFSSLEKHENESLGKVNGKIFQLQSQPKVSRDDASSPSKSKETKPGKRDPVPEIDGRNISNCHNHNTNAVIHQSQKSFLNTPDIPFLDTHEQEQTASIRNSKFPEVHDTIATKEDARFRDSIESKKSQENASNEVVKHADDVTLSVDDVIVEEKPLSVSPSEGAPVTDHDSGVGNDVESQESVTDVLEDSINHINERNSVPKVAREVSSSTGFKKREASVRRNEQGWIALVRTDNFSEKKPPVSLQIPNASDKSSSSFSLNARLITKEKVNVAPSRYVPASTLDSTKVTYSHEYHKARFLDHNRAGGKNRVADGIKKFENYIESKPISTKNIQPRIAAVSQPLALSKPAQTKPVFTAANSNKPMAIATILANTVRPQSEESVRKSEVPSKHIPTSVQDVVTSLETYTKTWDSKELSIPVHRVTEEDAQQLQVPSSENAEDSFSGRRVSGHARKSKFDEALAATKHKHFRDKLEKMIQQQHKDVGSLSTLTRKNSRGSTSSLASMPRITSPVPHHHSNTPLEQMTADNTAHHNEKISRSSKSASIHIRLKEKLQAPAAPNSNMQFSATSRSTSISRDRPGSERQINRRLTAQRSSLRSKTNAETKPSEEEKPKKSLEEQLGQLLLADKDQHFDSHIPTDSRYQQKQNISSSDPKRLSNSGKIRPADWKYQLLEYLERKKLEAGKIIGTESLGRNFSSESQTKSPTHSRIPNSSYLEQHKKARSNFVADDARSGLQYRHATSVPEINTQQEEKISKHDLMTKAQSSSHFTRSASSGHSRSSGRRSSGRYQRTRTPGPEMSQSKQTDVAVRPRSAMEITTQHFEQVDPTMTKSSKHPSHPQQEFTNQHHAYPAPPSYEDHLLRRGAGVATWNQQNYHDYVNVEFLHQFRVSLRNKANISAANPIGYPLRSTGSHDSVLNAKNEKSYPYEGEISTGIKGSASHNSIVDNRLQSKPNNRYPPYHAHQRDSYAHYDHKNAYRQSQIPPDYYRKMKESIPRQLTEKRNDYGVIPAPLKTAKQSVVKTSVRQEDPQSRSKKHNRESADNYGYPPPFRAYPPHPIHDGHGKSTKRLSAALQHGYGEREDESVASAFRPYHQQQSTRTRRNKQSYPNDVFDDYPQFHHQNHAESHYHPCETSNHASNRHHGWNRDYSKHHDPSLTERAEQHWRENDAGVEIVTVTVRKNPTFGFHIMGGIDAGGNPYRPDDDGVFITYVAPGGAADKLVQPGDKILLVNGSEFVGITHRRAVDLLRNAGHIAVLVVERLAGRPV